MDLKQETCDQLMSDMNDESLISPQSSIVKTESFHGQDVAEDFSDHSSLHGHVVIKTEQYDQGSVVIKTEPYCEDAFEPVDDNLETKPPAELLGHIKTEPCDLDTDFSHYGNFQENYSGMSGVKTEPEYDMSPGERDTSVIQTESDIKTECGIADTIGPSSGNFQEGYTGNSAVKLESEFVSDSSAMIKTEGEIETEYRVGDRTDAASEMRHGGVPDTSFVPLTEGTALPWGGVKNELNQELGDVPSCTTSCEKRGLLKIEVDDPLHPVKMENIVKEEQFDGSDDDMYDVSMVILEAI